MGQHALLAPSAAPQWGHCAGSVKVNANQPDLGTLESREGTAAHWVCLDMCLRNNVADASALLGSVDPDGTVIDEKMVEGAQCMIDDVRAVQAEHGGQLLIEHRVHMPHIHAENWGTLDCAVVLLFKDTLYLTDYKHGHGIVDAKENLQLIDYMSGLVAELGIDRDITIVFRIVQPFAYRSTGPVDEWQCKLSELVPYFEQLKRQAHEAMGPNPTLTTGKHCQHCAGVGRCDAAKRAGYNFVDVMRAPYLIDTMDGASLANERTIIENGVILAKARLKAIEDDLKHRIKSGDASTGLALETGYGHKKWSVPDDVAINFAAQFDIDIGKTVAITPTQAISKAPKATRALFEHTLKAVTKRDARGLNLIKADDSISHRAFKKAR